MPEYLSPGVYVEETSFRSRSIEGVSTSTAGFIGPTRYGPVSGEPELITSLADFTRIYGDLEDLQFTNLANPQVNYLAHGVRAFFEEGGRRMFVQRVFNAPGGFGIGGDGIPQNHHALGTMMDGELLAADGFTLVARFPGRAGNVRASFRMLVGSNVFRLNTDGGNHFLSRLSNNALVHVRLSRAAASRAIADGDTLQSIATDISSDPNFTVTAAELARANNLNVPLIVGETLIIPNTVYTAAAGDTPTSVQAGFPAALTITAAEIAEANGIAVDDVLAAGDTLNIPRMEYTIADDDTIASIADALIALNLDVTANAIAAANNMNPATNVTIRESSLTTGADTDFATIATDLTAGGLNITAAQIAAANDMAVGDAVPNGTEITIPRATYQLAAGDDLASIAAAMTGLGLTVTEEQILADNPATFPTPGRNLRIPALYVAQGTENGLMVARRTPTGLWELYDTNPDDGAAPTLSLDAAFTPAATLEVRPVSLLVEVAHPGLEPNTFGTPQTIGEFSLSRTARNALLNTFTANPDNRFDALTIPFAIVPDDEASAFSITLLSNLMGEDALDALSLDGTTADDVTVHYTLEDGDDGDLPAPGNYDGDAALIDFSGDILQMPLNGFLAFETVEDISIIASPGYTADRDETDAFEIQSTLINHCEQMQYRVAVLDTRENQTVTEALNFRNLRSSTHAAMYYPWIVGPDPRNSRNGQPLKLPPSGFIAGIYARNDNEHAVFKAPANEVVRLASSFEVQITQAHQDLLNPNGVNCLRFFEGRGYLVWGARTISDDPEWKYISVRRYFAYLERSIDRSTQWAVFENNGPRLWGNIRRSVEDFLYNEWVSGGLLGDKPEKAYFVRCDRSTMTQNDLDNGRLICLIGVAVVKPAEFVIFRIGQWTADADR